MRRYYPAVLAGVDGGQIDVAFPDLPGCVSVAESVEMAHARAAEALSFHLEGMASDGEPIPAGGDEVALLAMVKDFEDEGHRVLLASIPVDIPTGRAKRINVTLPEHVLAAADRWAKAHGETRSGLLASATLDYIARHR